jgi:hypothetical protein
MSKYRNIKTTVDGIDFDSKKEAQRYKDLLFLQRAGVIGEIILQPSFLLQEKFVARSGEKIREITYRADFAYKETNRQIWTVEDVKGFSKSSKFSTETKEFKLKKKMFLKRYPCIEYILL